MEEKIWRGRGVGILQVTVLGKAAWFGGLVYRVRSSAVHVHGLYRMESGLTVRNSRDRLLLASHYPRFH